MALWLTIFIGIFQLLLGSLGVYVSLRPPKPEHHWYWIGSFAAIGLIGVGLTAWLAVDGDRAEQESNTEIHAAQVAASSANDAATKANVAATNAATAATLAANAATASQTETREARTEATKETSSTQNLIAKESTETNQTILNWRSDTESAVSRILMAPRTLGAKKQDLINGLRSGAGDEVAITMARGNKEAIDFGNEIQSAFELAGWKIVPTHQFVIVQKDGFGLQMMVKNPATITPQQTAAGKAFYDIGHPFTALPSDELKPDSPVEVYVGLQQ